MMKLELNCWFGLKGRGARVDGYLKGKEIEAKVITWPLDCLVPFLVNS